MSLPPSAVVTKEDIDCIYPLGLPKDMRLISCSAVAEEIEPIIPHLNLILEMEDNGVITLPAVVSFKLYFIQKRIIEMRDTLRGQKEGQQ